MNLPSVNNFKDLEKLVQKKIAKTVKSPQVLKVFRQAMVDSVYTEVYDYYQPSEYERRYDDGGLSDARNMAFTSHELKGNTFVSDFENLTVGSDATVYDYPTDSMNGYFISDLIENGSNNTHTSPANSENGWYNPDGRWADPRPFAKATAEKLNRTTYNKHLKDALERGINE